MDYLRRLQLEQPAVFWVLMALGLFVGFRLVLFVASLLLGPFGLPSWAPIVVVVGGLILDCPRASRECPVRPPASGPAHCPAPRRQIHGPDCLTQRRVAEDHLHGLGEIGDGHEMAREEERSADPEGLQATDVRHHRRPPWSRSHWRSAQR